VIRCKFSSGFELVDWIVCLVGFLSFCCLLERFSLVCGCFCWCVAVSRVTLRRDWFVAIRSCLWRAVALGLLLGGLFVGGFCLVRGALQKKQNEGDKWKVVACFVGYSDVLK